MVRSPANRAPELDADQLIVFLMPKYPLSATKSEFEKFRPKNSKGLAFGVFLLENELSAGEKFGT